MPDLRPEADRLLTVLRVLGIVPARGGSKAIPRKNLALLAGRPLLSFTCAAIGESRLLDRAILSTDDEEIAAVARQSGVEVPFMRPAAIAGDASPMLDVLTHALAVMASMQYVPDAVAVLQPTSPLRRGHHIDAAIQRLVESRADSVVTVVRVPHQYAPGSLMQLQGERLEPFQPDAQALRRQEKPILFARNGPAVLAVRRHVIEAGGLYGADVRALEMSAAESVDIDDPIDMELAEFWLARRRQSER